MLVLLLCGSDKRDQDREITRAIGYRNDWKERGNHEYATRWELHGLAGQNR